MMKSIKAISKLPGASDVLSNKIIGRIITQVVNGFGEDEQLVNEMAVFRALETAHPKTVMTMMEMYRYRLRKASKELNPDVDLSAIPEEQREMWEEGELSEHQQLVNAFPQLNKIYFDATGGLEAWKELPPIAQWSLLSTLERGLPQKAKTYAGWNNARGNAKQAVINRDIPKVYKIITEFLEGKTVAAALAADKANGVNVPERQAA